MQNTLLLPIGTACAYIYWQERKGGIMAIYIVYYQGNGGRLYRYGSYFRQCTANLHANRLSRLGYAISMEKRQLKR